jgi:trans-aconitate methyltransferase
MGNFEFDGEKYKQASKPQKGWGNRLISELEIRGDETILDLGCGDGVLTGKLSELVPDGTVVGIDASAGMIGTAKKIEKKNLTFIQMDIDKIDFVETFDIIFSNAALHWVKDHDRLLKNSFSALKHNGAIVWNFAAEGNCSDFFGIAKEMMKKEEYREYFSDFEWPWFMPSKEEYEKKS